MKANVCKGCGTIQNQLYGGKPWTNTCKSENPDCGQFEEIEVDLETVQCTHCKNKGKDVSHYWSSLPFYNFKKNTFYCGCHGF